MILMALIIGFAGSWLLGERTFQFLRSELGSLQTDKHRLGEQLKMLEKENQSARQHMAAWQREVSLLAQVKKVTEPLLIQAKNQVSSLEQQLEQHQRRYEILKKESDSIRDTAALLKLELEKEKVREEQLKKEREIEAAEAREKKENKAIPVNLSSRFTPSSWQKKDDLTLISGIGPVIQRKLNELGIYSFQQLSELKPDTVDLIAKTIKFFPDRIARDNWIGQAAAFMYMKR
jgi:predicted flap endonuclease-1-like 5' DNA nuclease